jgi:hypothetical protein
LEWVEVRGFNSQGDLKEFDRPKIIIKWLNDVSVFKYDKSDLLWSSDDHGESGNLSIFG